MSFHRLPRLRIITSVKDNFSVPVRQCCPVVSFLIVFSLDRFHEVVNPRNRFGDLLFPPRVHGLLCLAKTPSALRPCRKFTIDPFARHITVTTQLYGRPITASVDSDISGSQVSGCFIFDLLPDPFTLFFLCSMDRIILSRTNETNLYFPSSILFNFRALIQFSSQAHSVTILSTHFRNCAILTCASILCGFLDPVSSSLSVGCATISYFDFFETSNHVKKYSCARVTACSRVCTFSGTT